MKLDKQSMSYSQTRASAAALARTIWRHRILVALLLVVGVFGVELGLLKLPKANAAYTISNSARFISGNSAYLSWTPTPSGSQSKWTISMWVKRSALGTEQFVFSAGSDANNHTGAYFTTGDALGFFDMSASVVRMNKVTSALFRDPVAWYHLVFIFDSNNASAADRQQIWVNGVRVTSFSASTDATSGISARWNNGSGLHAIGRRAYTAASFYDGYLADVYAIDNAALAPTSFGETDSNGYWRPKAYTGTYGTNGFKLAFGNGAALGTDTSGNSNTFTASGLAATDQVTDTPTNSFATFSPVDKIGTGTFNFGNLAFYSAAAGDATRSTIGVSSGKWYFEAPYSNSTGGDGCAAIGVESTNNAINGATSIATIGSGTYVFRDDGYKINNGTGVSGLTNYGNGDVIMVALDMDNGKIWFGTNGVWEASGVPASGTNAQYTGLSGTFSLYANFQCTNSTMVYSPRFGQGGAAGLTYDSASGGYFKYAPPSGFKALSTYNLPEPAISVPKNYFDTVTYTGWGVARSVTAAAKVIYLTSGTTWTVPNDWNSSDNAVEVIGGGGGGANGLDSNVGYSGGGGGGYSKVSNVTLSGGSSVSYAVGTGGAAQTSDGAAGNSATDTYFCNSTSNCASIVGSAVQVGAKGGTGGPAGQVTPGGAGGSSASGVGTTKYSGGTGGGYTGTPYGGAGGGGAAGPNGAGNTGGVTTASTATGGSGDNGVGGAGGAGSSAGSVGKEWDATHGSGGGGGGGAPGATGGTGGLYGGGGGGGGGNGSPGTGAAGADGIIVITYTPFYTLNFQPDLVWIKDRTSALMHNIFDSVRAVIPYWSSNSTAAEVGGFGTALTSFLSNGFSLGSNALFNTSGNNYVSWMWKESATAGMDIVTYTGTGVNGQAVAHSLGATPDMVILKDRSTGTPGTVVYHSSIATPSTNYLQLQSTAATAASAGFLTPSATELVFTTSYAGNNALNVPYVAYAFKGIEGFSKFGTYTGNGSADGPFIYTGFKPRYVMYKVSSGSAIYDWVIYDTARDSENPVGRQVYPSLNNAEDDGRPRVDYLSNGFKLRSANNPNASGLTYIYAAFADVPFQQSAQPYNLTIASSTRFISGNSAYLSKTFGSAGTSRKTWTWSGWLKLGNRVAGGSTGYFFGNEATGFDLFGISSNVLTLLGHNGSTYDWNLTTTQVFRDPAKWYHVVVDFDTTQATAANRIKVYVDGRQVTAFSTATYPSLNYDARFINNANNLWIGRSSAGSYWDGYLSDMYFIDGQALDPSSFGEYDTNGYWRPKTYSGSYGTNGFHLPLTSASTPGDDTGTNNADWTASGLASTDNVKDSPTNSFATLSPIDNGGVTLASGNLNFTTNTKTVRATFGVSSGKWYWEVNAGSGSALIGIARNNASLSAALGSDVYGWAYYGGSGNTYHGGSLTSYGNTYAANVIGVALDADAGTLIFYKDGVAQTTYQAQGIAFTGLTNGPYFAAVGDVGASWSSSFNFGAGGVSGLTYDSASGGYFKYTPPSGYKALSTANLPTPTVTVPKNYFDAVTYTGTGAVKNVLQSSTSSPNVLGFTPDLVWIKDRTSANAHGIFDSSRTLYPAWASNSSGAEGGAGGTALSSFLSNGFSLGASSTVNTLGDNFVAWLWKKCPAVVAVLCPASNGVDIVTYTGNGSGSDRAIAHSLGAAPDMVIVKSRSNGRNNFVWHSSFSNATYFLTMDTTNAQDTSGSTVSPFGTGVMNSSQITVRANATYNGNATGENYVAYVFKGIDGFSKFGSYTANGAADGPFVYTGFKPRFILRKRIDSAADGAWLVIDTARDTYNSAGKYIFANSSAAEGATTDLFDILSNGFKLRSTSGNVSGGTYIYAAFAEQPFKYSAASAASTAVFTNAASFLMGMTY